MPSESDEDIVKYGEILAGLNYEPSIKLGRETFVSTFRDLQETGDLDPSLNLEEFTKKVYPTLENVPETIIYDKESNTFKEKEKGCCGD